MIWNGKIYEHCRGKIGGLIGINHYGGDWVVQGLELKYKKLWVSSKILLDFFEIKIYLGT